MRNEYDRLNQVNCYSSRYYEHGYSMLTLGWNKGKQDVRFDNLVSDFASDIASASCIDLGCGFGDFLPYWRACGGEGYIGVDIVPELINEAKMRLGDIGDSLFVVADFLDEDFNYEADFIVASGPFNYKFEHASNYDFIEQCLRKSFFLCKNAVSFNFLSDKVDWKNDHAWYSSPSTILDIAFVLSRNIILRNNYMPFEFNITVFKDDSFEASDTLFTRYKNKSI